MALSISSLSAAWRCACAVLLCVATALLCLPLMGYLDLANIVMLFLLAVALIAVVLGKGPAIVSAFLCVALFDYLFVEPHFSFAVHDSQYLVTFVVMLLVALLIGHLSTILQKQLQLAREREQAMRALYECARVLAGAVMQEQVLGALQSCLMDSVQGRVVKLFLPDEKEHLRTVYADPAHAATESMVDHLVAATVYAGGEIQEIKCEEDGRKSNIYLPLVGSTRMRGVLVVSIPAYASGEFSDKKPFLQALASLTVTALERLHFVDAAQAAELQMQTERLRSSILSALSHDIRTPLTVLCGLADTLKLMHPDLPDTARDIVDALRTHTVRLHGMVDNLLDMARLHSGRIVLHKEWQPLEEVIGASIHLLGDALTLHRIEVRIAADVPLVNIDAVLLERVFCNLLENACKYSPPQSRVVIGAVVADEMINVSVADQGKGFADGDPGRLLDIFERGEHESTASGFGVGLAICRSIVEAHNGCINAFNSVEGGACVMFTLPLGTPPVIELEEFVEP